MRKQKPSFVIAAKNKPAFLTTQHACFWPVGIINQQINKTSDKNIWIQDKSRFYHEMLTYQMWLDKKLYCIVRSVGQLVRYYDVMQMDARNNKCFDYNILTVVIVFSSDKSTYRGSDKSTYRGSDNYLTSGDISMPPSQLPPVVEL